MGNVDFFVFFFQQKHVFFFKHEHTSTRAHEVGRAHKTEAGIFTEELLPFLYRRPTEPWTTEWVDNAWK